MTRPLTFAGRSLFVNADVRDGGWGKAAVRSAKDKPIASYGLDEAVPLTRDTTRGRLTWRDATKLKRPGEGHVRLQFQLKHAKLYAFWVE